MRTLLPARSTVAAGLVAALAAMPLVAAPPAAAAPLTEVLVFHKTAGFQHPSIPNGVNAIRQLGQQNGFTVTATADANAFTTTNLARFQAVVWLSTTGDVLDASQQAAFESYIGGGGGYVGVHAAADTEYDWAWYGGLVGAYFHSHPANQQARIRVEDRSNVSTAHLPETWTRVDEWYNYRTNPRPAVRVLASLDESSYSGGNMGDHPITWCQDYRGGRAWYTGLGHTEESYSDPNFTRMLLGGIQIAGGASPADCRPAGGGATDLARGRPVTVSSVEAGSSHNGANAVDGNPQTRWSSAFSDPQWIAVDLGTTRTFSRVRLTWEAAYGRGYRIQTSPDNATWTTVYSTTTGDGGTDDITVGGTGRHVRVEGLQRATQWGYSLWNLEVLGAQ